MSLTLQKPPKTQAELRPVQVADAQPLARLRAWSGVELT